MGEPLLAVDGMSVSYWTAAGVVRAVEDVSFTISRGETFGLVGESGSGKTTLAMAVLRLVQAPGEVVAGRVVLDGTDLYQLEAEELRRARWRDISLVPQGAQNSLNPVMRVRDQVADAIVDHEGRLASRALRSRVVELLAAVGLPEQVSDRFPHELSGGMQQRVCIALAVALKPKLIVADEPTSALDVVAQRLVAETLTEAQGRLGAGMLLIGHDMGLQAQMVDRLAVMYKGHLVEVGPAGSVFKAPAHPYTQHLISSVPPLHQRSAPNQPPYDTAKTGEFSVAACLRNVGPDHLAAVP
jgi:ABC-type dipeptide/oligopeptide/nickel transport system ATPase component